MDAAFGRTGAPGMTLPASAGTAARAVETKSPADLWVFAYGSLMWDPGFAYAERMPAVLEGYRRAFCVWSMSHRGTPERPGLVLGLAPGGACHGLVYRVEPGREAEVQAYLFERERRRYDVYREAVVAVRYAGGTVAAQTYVADPESPGYAGDLDEADAVRHILVAVGERGPNLDYLTRTLGQLRALGIHEPAIERLHDIACALSQTGR